MFTTSSRNEPLLLADTINHIEQTRYKEELLMEFMLDTADVARIRDLNELITVAGVTTNPTILTKSGRMPEDVLPEIISILSPEQKLFVQVVKTDYEGIMDEARKISAMRPENMYVKIPVSRDGLKALKQCRKEGIKTLATAIYTPAQGFLAAQNGANYLAPYTNRMCNYGDGVAEVLKLNRMIKENGLDSKVIAASFKNVGQVSELIENGIGAVTVPADVVYEMINHPATRIAVGEFCVNWNRAYMRDTLFDESEDIEDKLTEE